MCCWGSTFDGVTADADNVMLTRQREVPAPPHEADQHAAPANEGVGAPEAQDLGLAQMVDWADVGPALQGNRSGGAPSQGICWCYSPLLSHDFHCLLHLIHDVSHESACCAMLGCQAVRRLVGSQAGTDRSGDAISHQHTARGQPSVPRDVIKALLPQ